MTPNSKIHYTMEMDNNSFLDCYILSPGITLSFNHIHTGNIKNTYNFEQGRYLFVNFCIDGRCDVILENNQHAIVKKDQLCISTIAPSKDFYYPGEFYEGIEFFIDRNILSSDNYEDFLTLLGLYPNNVATLLCSKKGIYFMQMTPTIKEYVYHTWKQEENLDTQALRYFTVLLFHEMLELPSTSECETFFTRSQIAIVKDAEKRILNDLSTRITAKQLADEYGISESSFKLYVKGILGDTYLSYFRRKRMERAAWLLENTTLKVIDIASSVGYENQGKFAKAFSNEYGVSPLEYRRLSK